MRIFIGVHSFAQVNKFLCSSSTQAAGCDAYASATRKHRFTPDKRTDEEMRMGKRPSNSGAFTQCSINLRELFHQLPCQCELRR